MSIVLVGSTSGSITLQEPAVAGSNTINLPASTGTMALLQTPSFATTIGVGGATPSTSGAGITFPATQSASTDANTLDDYEEGSWTPVLTGSTGTPTVAYNAQVGTYTKIGRLVNIQCYIDTSSRSGGSGDVRITGLPFTAANSSTSYCGVMASQCANITGATNLGIRPFANQAYLECFTNGAGAVLALSNWSNTGYFLVTLTYIV